MRANVDKLGVMAERRNSLDNEQWHHLEEGNRTDTQRSANSDTSTPSNGPSKLARKVSMHFDDEDEEFLTDCMLHHNSSACVLRDSLCFLDELDLHASTA